MRVLTDVLGMDKEFDYLVPAGQAPPPVGSQLRVDLGPRRVGAWVLAELEEARLGLRSYAKWRGHGPEPCLFELAGWAGRRWVASRAAFLRAADPPRAVAVLPQADLRPPAQPPGPEALALTKALAEAGRAGRPLLAQLGPAADPTWVVAAAAGRGPTLVVLPSRERARVLAARLTRAGAGVALLPEEWAQARAGAGVVVGARGTAWGPCPGMAAAVVLDAHDEGLCQEQSPTWGAVEVLARRCSSAGAPLLLLTPCPTPELVRLGGEPLDLERPGRRTWAATVVVDMRRGDPREGLYSPVLIDALRRSGRVMCVLNRKGRAKLLACRSCGEVARCERCGSPLREAAVGWLSCDRCEDRREAFCSSCASIRLKRLVLGVSRVKEELEALANEPVGEYTSGQELPATRLVVATEAGLRAASPAQGFELVAFLDFDQELLAPRVRASAEALGLLALASRLVRGREGTVVVQTRLPAHPVIQAAVAGQPRLWWQAELALREQLRLPPAVSVALISGPAAPALADALRSFGPALEVGGPFRGSYLVKAPDAATLSTALWDARGSAPKARVAIDPGRL